MTTYPKLFAFFIVLDNVVPDSVLSTSMFFFLFKHLLNLLKNILPAFNFTLSTLLLSSLAISSALRKIVGSSSKNSLAKVVFPLPFEPAIMLTIIFYFKILKKLILLE